MTTFRSFSVKIASLMLAGALIASCTEPDEDNEQGPFDRSAMLTAYADNTVIPAYAQLLSNLEVLTLRAEDLQADVSAAHLEAAQQAWIDAYKTWQSANAFNFGPAGEQGLQKGLIEEIGTFPISESKVKAILDSETYNLSDFNRDARGFLVVEYLLFAPTETGGSSLDRLSDAFARQFLLDLVQNIQARVQGVHGQWTSGYRDTFVRNNGTDVGSSTSQFYNEFVRSYEALKNFKVGLPLGLRPGQVEAAPHLVEAGYSGTSREMMELHFNAIENIWVGRDSQDRDGLGFEDYLQTVVGGPDLIEATKAQIASVHEAFNAVPFDPSFAEQTITAPEMPIALHTELQKQTRFFKSDMSSLLGIAITFSSGDGD